MRTKMNQRIYHTLSALLSTCSVASRDSMYDELLFRKWDRKYPDDLPDPAQLPWPEFVRYCVERLWERKSAEMFGREFDDLEEMEKINIDILSHLDLMKAVEEIKNESDCILRVFLEE